MSSCATSTVPRAATASGTGFRGAASSARSALPEGGQVKEAELNALAKRLHKAIEHASHVGDIKRDEEARKVWYKVYPELSEGKPRLWGAMRSRAEAHVMRLSAIYALLDCSSVVRAGHLKAALALWEYCEAFARFTFGDALGDPLADKVLALLRTNPEGLTRTEIYNHFGRHEAAEQIKRVLKILTEQGLATWGKKETEGGPRTIWRTVSSAQKAYKA